MKQIILNKGKVSLVDDEDYETVNKFKWYFDSVGYATITTYRNRIRMHRFILNPKKNQIVDHVNGDRLDNRRCNLRLCTRRQNQCNQKTRKDNTSGYKGVALMHNKYWRAYINKDGKQKHLGIFKTKEEAGKEYDKFALILYGKFAKTNF